MPNDSKPEYLGDFGGAPADHETTPIGVAAEAERAEKAVQAPPATKAITAPPETK